MDAMPIVPSPATLIELGRATVGRAIESVASLATVPVRLLGVLGQVELLVNRITVIADQTEALVIRVSGVADDAEVTAREARAIAAAAAIAVEEVARISSAASSVIGEVDTATAEARDLLEAYAPTLRRAAPLAARFVDELSPEEVTAAIRMVDTLPRLRLHLVEDVLPLLGKLDQVGPDLHKLLAVTEDLHLAIAGLPGLRMLRRRGEDRANGD